VVLGDAELAVLFGKTVDDLKNNKVVIYADMADRS